MPKKRATRSKKRKGFNMDGTERKAGSGGVRTGAGRPPGSKNKSKVGEMMKQVLRDNGIDPDQEFVDYWKDPEISRAEKVKTFAPYFFPKEVQRQEIEKTNIEFPDFGSPPDEDDKDQQ